MIDVEESRPCNRRLVIAVDALQPLAGNHGVSVKALQPLDEQLVVAIGNGGNPFGRDLMIAVRNNQFTALPVGEPVVPPAPVVAPAVAPDKEITAPLGSLAWLELGSTAARDTAFGGQSEVEYGNDLLVTPVSSGNDTDNFDLLFASDEDDSELFDLASNDEEDSEEVIDTLFAALGA